jgi:MFS family permease
VCLLSTVVAAVLAYVGDSLPRPAFLALSAIFGGLALTLYSLAISHVNDHLEAEQMVDSSSALIMLNGFGAVAGPVLAGSLIAAYGPPAYFTMLAGLMGALTIFDVWRKLRRKPVAVDQKGPFISAQPQAIAGRIVAAAAQEKMQ